MKYAFMVGMIGLALGMWIMWGAIATTNEFTTPFGGHFVRVETEPGEESCEEWVCDEWIESYEWKPCGLKECYSHVRECISRSRGRC